MDALKLQQLQQSFAEQAKGVYNAKTKALGVRAVGLFWDAEDNSICIRIMEDIYSNYTAQRVFEGLDYAKEYGLTPKIELYTYGGDLYEAIAIYDRIKGEGINVSGAAWGFVGSAGTVVLCACNVSSIGLNSIWMMHRATARTSAPKEWLAKSNTALENIYIAKTGKSREEISVLLDASKGEGSFLTANEALEMGFVNNISGADNTEMVEAIAAHYQHQFINKIQNMTLIERLKNALGFKADATDDEVVEAVEQAVKPTDPVPPVETPAPVVEEPTPAEIEAKVTAAIEARINAAVEAAITAANTKVAEVLAKLPNAAPTPAGGVFLNKEQQDERQSLMKAAWDKLHNNK